MQGKIKMFRAYRDPHIPPKPRNAFTMGNAADQLPGIAELCPYGVHVVTQPSGREYIVPWANVECIELFPEEVKLKKVKE